MAKTINKKITLNKVDKDEIFLDIDNALTYSNKVKKDLTNIYDSMMRIKKIYAELRDHPKTKGKFKKTISKMANGASKKATKTKAIKSNLESSLKKSISDYREALEAFKKLDSTAEQLGNEGDSGSSGSSGNTGTTSTPTTQTTAETSSNPRLETGGSVMVTNDDGTRTLYL